MKEKDLKDMLIHRYNSLYKYLYEEGYCEDDEDTLDEDYYFIKGRMHELALILNQLGSNKYLPKSFKIVNREGEDR